MDATTLNTIVGIIGIIVGVLGWKQLSAATEIKTKNKNSVKADNGAIVHQDSSITINNGLSSKEVFDLATETATEVVKKGLEPITPGTILTLGYITCSIASFIHKGSSYVHTFNCMMGNGKSYILNFETEQDNVYSSIKCSILDFNGNKLKLCTLSEFLEILPQNIYRDLVFNNNEVFEAIIEPSQTIIGKTSDDNIIVASIKPGPYWSCYHIRVALYVPFEVIP